MTQIDDRQRSEAPAVQTRPKRTAGRRTRQWANVAVAVAGIVVAAYLSYQVPPYFSLNPARSRIELKFPLHFFLIATHVFAGTVALTTLVVQLSPWMRRHHPAVHRWSGRLYVFAGVLPTAGFAIVMFPVAFKSGAVGALVSAIFWIWATMLGYVRGRQGRWAEHRQWMLYSFAIVWGETVWGFVIGEPFAVWGPWGVDFTYVAEAARWVGFVGNVVAMHWYLSKTAHRPVYGPRRGKVAVDAV